MSDEDPEVPAAQPEQVAAALEPASAELPAAPGPTSSERPGPALLRAPGWLDAVSVTAVQAVQGAMETAVGQVARLVDRGALGVMRRAFSAPGNRGVRVPDNAREKLLRLSALYGRPEHFSAPETFFPRPERASVTEKSLGQSGITEVVDLTYPSRYLPHLEAHRASFGAAAANLVVHARHYRRDGAVTGRARPTLICIHGWGGGSFWMEQVAFPVRYFLRLGLDVVLFTLPYHALRTPAGHRSGAVFPSWNVVHTNEGFGQAIHDLRALIDWLLDRGAPSVGVLGMSLGGYTTALLASVEPRLAYAVPMIPVSSLADVMWEAGKGTRARQLATEAGVSRELLADAFAVHTPLRRPPLVPPAARLILAGLHDRIAPPAQAQRLWHHWGQPAIHWFDGGHLLQANRRPAFRRFRQLLGDLGIIESREARHPAGPTPASHSDEAPPNAGPR